MQRPKLLSIVKEIVLDYAHRVQMAVKALVKVVKVVVKMDVKIRVATDVDKVAKDVVSRCAKATV